jgi:protein gp37
LHESLIEWIVNPDGSTPGYVSQPLTGCYGPEGKGPCFYCYAETLANGRIKPHLLKNKQCIGDPNDPFSPRWWKDELSKVYHTKKRCGIFLNSESDWLADWVPLLWQQEIYDYIKLCDWHRFYILTKHPLNLFKFSPWPDNCYVGATVDAPDRWNESLVGISGIKAKIKFISFEPLLGRIPLDAGYKFSKDDLQWIIIGALTGHKNRVLELGKQYPELTPAKLPDSNKWSLQPQRSWVDELISEAKKEGIKVWLKDSLRPTMGKLANTLKEIP